MITDPIAVAIEHIIWCALQGISLATLHSALGAKAGAPFKNWEDAFFCLSRIARDMQRAAAARGAA